MTEPERMGSPALIWCPFPNEESAGRVVNSLLDERLVACANMIPAMRSLFEWDGKRSDTRETGVVLKTDAALLDSAIQRLADLHPYEEPAITGWLCDSSTAGTAAWLGALVP